MSKKELKTEVEIGEYKNSPMIIIHELDDEGKRKPFPVVQFGVKKARAIVKHQDEIQAFVVGNEK